MNENNQDVSPRLQPVADIAAVLLGPLVLIATGAATDVVAVDVHAVSCEGEEVHHGQ
jgi:hypothetical protein